MKSTTAVMFFTSLWFVVIGTFIYVNKSFKDKLEHGVKNVKDKKGYVRFNALYNIIVGVLGIIIAIADFFIKSMTWITVGTFAIAMLGAYYIQQIIGKKYR